MLNCLFFFQFLLFIFSITAPLYKVIISTTDFNLTISFTNLDEIDIHKTLSYCFKHSLFTIPILNDNAWLYNSMKHIVLKILPGTI